MLRRNSSKRLDRRKSTSSAYSKPDSIDPTIARQHAYTAATLAFNRARERNSADGGYSGNRNNRSQTLGTQQNNTGNAEQPIRRQHSVRFVGSDGGIERRQSIGTRALNNPIRPKTSTATLKPMAITTNAPVPAAYRPPSRSSSIGKASGGRAESFVSASAFDEYYAQGEEELTSTPSSYRRIRRSKSMYSPRQAPNVYFTNGTPNKPESSYNGRTAFSSSETPQNEPLAAALRAPKSMSFLRGIRSQENQDRNDNAVQVARDRFFRETEQQRLRAQPSFIFRSNAQKQEKPKPFRKSLRTSSGQSSHAIASSQAAQQPRESSLRDAARKASQTIKSKIKKVFGRNKNEPIAVPNQQVEAKETHVRNYNGDKATLHEVIVDIPHPDHAALTRVASRVPSLHAIPSNQQLRSHAGSVKSFKSFKSDHSDDKSRVTSWQSTGANTITTIAAKVLSERDQQRLSIINENGTHISSSSFARNGLTNQFSAYPVVHRPTKNSGNPSCHVDSARVYSALMKRLDENSPQAKLEASRKASADTNCSPARAPQYQSSVHNSREKSTPATIRQVMPSETTDGSGSESEGSSQHAHHWVRVGELHSARAEDMFGYTGKHIHQWQAADSLREARMRDEDDVFSPSDDNSSDKENIPPGEGKNKRNSLAVFPPISYEKSHNAIPAVPLELDPTPQEIALRNEPIVHPRTLRERKSTFFGGSSYTLQRTQSPFRRAMAENDGNHIGVTNDMPILRQLPPLRNPLYLAISAEERRDREDIYTDSVYSRTTSGQAPAFGDSQVSLPICQKEVPEIPAPPKLNGDVVILNQTTYRPTRPNGSGHRTTSSAGSMEWKTWMSTEVAKLEKSKENTRSAAYVNYALPTMPKSFQGRHVREAAQINDDEIEISQRKVSIAKQPLALVQQSHPNIQAPNLNTQAANPTILAAPPLRPILKNRSKISLAESTELTDQATLVPLIPIPPPPPPPIPPRSPLRATQSRSSMRSIGTTNTIKTISAPNSITKPSTSNARNVLHKRNTSQSTLHSVKSFNASIKSIETPAKLVKRNYQPPTTSNQKPVNGSFTAVEKQFGSTSTNSKRRTPGSPKENVRFEQEEDIYEAEGAGLTGPRMSTTDIDAQIMGSKTMVEMFLSSRRKRIVSPSEEAGSLFL